MLKLDRVSKFYSTNGVVTAGFSKVSLEFELGEFVAITGESGSGKSTLLNVISGLDSYEEGEMYIFGQPTSGYGSSDLEDYRKRYIGNIFQTFNLINHYTVYQNIELTLLLAGYEAAEVKDRVDDIIHKVGLDEYRNTKTSKLSGGQKQRVAIARALAKETPIIVADEPTGNLDVASARDIIKLLSGLSKDKLIIIVTHNYEQVEPYVTRKISMHDGRIAEDKVLNPRPSTQENDISAPSSNGFGSPSASDSGATSANDSGAPSSPDSSKIKAMEVRNGVLSTGNTARLGTRNAFSLPAKFLLLLFVFIFLTTGTFASYSTYTGMKNGISNSVFGYLFNDTSPTRVLLTKPDGEVFDDNDLNKIKAMDNIAFVEKNDALMDCSFSLTNEPKSFLYGEDNYAGSESQDITFWVDVSPSSLEAFYGEDSSRELIRGRLPETENEALLLIEKDGFIDTNQIDEIFEKTGYLECDQANLPADDFIVPIKIVGIAHSTENELDRRWRTSLWYEAKIVLTPEGMDRLEALATVGNSATELKIGNNILSVGPPPWHDIWLVADESVEEGTAVLPAFLGDSVMPESEMAEDIFDIFRSRITLRTRSKYFDRNKSLRVSDVDYEDDRLRLNPKDLWEIYAAADKYQVSAYLGSEFYQAETRAALEEAGYDALYLSESADKQMPIEKALIGAMRIVVLVLLLGVLFFVVYFITKLIMKSQNVYYSTVRMLGGNEKACSGTLLAELLVIFHIAFAICLGIMIKISLAGSQIMPGYFVRLVRYIEPWDYVILYLVVLGMTLLLAYRYSNQMFKKTAMNAYREEV